MRLSSVLSSISLALYASSAAALNPLVIKGNKFFDSVTGDQFYIKGVAYQPLAETGPSKDPLADPETCKRDIYYFKDLNLNTIRVYDVDNTLNHDECMKALDDAGIYLVLDISTPKYSINREDPNYDLELLNHFKNTTDAFAGYPNVLGFFAGNEVVNRANVTESAPFVKASIRDIKKYLKTKKRYIPVGYSTNDAPIRLECADYFNCGHDADRVDFYGYNIYSWCGNEATFKSSQYAARTKDFSTYNVPVFLSEFGCNTNGVRTFHQVKAIFGPDMDDTFSGGIVFEYSEQKNNYGIVNIGSDGSVTTRPSYEYLKSELSQVSPTIRQMSSYTPSSSLVTSQCPAISSVWEASTNLPPTPSEEVCSTMYDSLECVLNEQSGKTPDYGSLYSYLCTEVSCKEIAANGTTGEYGKYSACNPNQRLSYMFNEYYVKDGKKAKGCDFQGFGTIVTPTKKSLGNSSSSSSTGSSSSGSSSTGSSTAGSSGPTGASDDKSDHKNGAQSMNILSALTFFAVSAVSYIYL